MSRNPHSEKEHRRNSTLAKASLKYGYVIDTVEENNEIEVQPLGEDTSTKMSVAVSADGDVSFPDGSKANDEKLLAVYGSIGAETPIVLGYFYDETVHDIPSADRGERRIGHGVSDANIFFHKDGQITVESDGGAKVTLQPDGTVVINDGTSEPITNLSVTKDADGHVTDITTTTASGVLL